MENFSAIKHVLEVKTHAFPGTKKNGKFNNLERRVNEGVGGKIESMTWSKKKKTSHVLLDAPPPSISSERRRRGQ